MVEDNFCPPPWTNAIYQELDQLPRYQGNPLIEALPPILSDSDALKALADFPKMSPDDTKLPDEVRFHALYHLGSYFFPLSSHLDLQRKVSLLLRAGYIGRNPISKKFYPALKQLAHGQVREDTVLGPSPSFNLIGLSGVGKSVSIRKVLSLYPQIIKHNEYHDQPFNFTQISWLRVDCPFDASVRGLLVSIFSAMDQVLGSNYNQVFVERGRPSLDQIIISLRNILSLHGVGCLVIDEIQNISVAKGQGVSMMLNFFLNLINVVGVPVILVGTPKSLEVLTRELQLIRRGCGLGDLFWDRMKNDSTWRQFTTALLRYQYVRTFNNDFAALSDALYHASQGIIDFAVKSFFLSQQIAIVNRTEKISAELITNLGPTHLINAQPVLDAIRHNDYRLLQSFPDIGIYSMERTYSDVISAEKPPIPLSPVSQVENILPENSESPKPVVQKPRSSRRKTSDEKTQPAPPACFPPDDLRTIFLNQEASPFENLKKLGVIKKVDEFFM